MRQAVVRHQRRDVRQFGLLRAQKFLARRHVEEQIANRDRRAAAQRRFLAAQHLAAGDFDARAGGLLRGARLEQQPRDRRDGRQRLAAKSQRGDREQVLDVAQLAGGVALEGQHRVVAQHAAAVVDDADQAAPAGFDFDAQIGSAGVERIFEQFLDHRRRPLHHFAGRDLVGDLVGKNADAAHEEECSPHYNELVGQAGRLRLTVVRRMPFAAPSSFTACRYAAHLLPHEPVVPALSIDIQNPRRIDAPEKIHEEGDQAGPPRLVAGSQPRSVVAVEVFVEQDEVAPVRIFLELLRPSIYRPPAILVAQESARQPALNLFRHLEQRHVPAGTGRTLNLELIAEESRTGSTALGRSAH